MYVSHNLNNY